VCDYSGKILSANGPFEHPTTYVISLALGTFYASASIFRNSTIENLFVENVFNSPLIDIISKPMQLKMSIFSLCSKMFTVNKISTERFT